MIPRLYKAANINSWGIEINEIILVNNEGLIRRCLRNLEKPMVWTKNRIERANAIIIRSLIRNCRYGEYNKIIVQKRTHINANYKNFIK